MNKKKTQALVCVDCGCHEFERVTQRDDLVKLFRASIGVRDRVVKEGGAEFTYNCSQCGQPFDNE